MRALTESKNLQNKGRERKSWKSGRQEWKEHPLVSVSMCPQPADHVWLQPHTPSARLWSQNSSWVGSSHHPSKQGNLCASACLTTVPHPSLLFEVKISTISWHIVDYEISVCLLQLSCMSDLGWGISLYTKLSIQVIKIGFFSFCKCNTFHIFTSSCLDSISLFSFLVLALSYLMWISRAWCP